MTKNYLEEGELKKLIKRYTPDSQFYNYRPKDFIAYQVNGEWCVTFTYLDKAGYEWHIKRTGVKTFSDLDAVGKRLLRIGITEFKALL
jgi:hypothetical protein